MKIAIVHYWMVSMRGGEKVVEALCKSFPEADIFTHVYVKELLSQDILRHKITTSFISRLPFSKKLYKRYLPLMPIALEELDLRDYDVVISSEAGPAEGDHHPSRRFAYMLLSYAHALRLEYVPRL